MQPVEDSALLRRYADHHSDEAFAALVTRHINLVYSVALRQVGHPQDAEEITQAVFIILARKAAGLRHERALSSWLFRTTRLTAINFVRGELRRRHREQEASMQTILNEPGGEFWPQIAPLLDDAVARLRELERRAIVLRFYEGCSLREVGLALGASEEATKKRVARALEKLGQFFAKRGVNSTAAAIGETISANSVQAAPAVLAKTVTAVALAKGAAASTSTLTLVKGALKIMAWTKTKTAIVATAVVLVAAGTTTVTIKKIEGYRVEDSWRIQPIFDSRILDRASPQVRILPAKFSQNGGYGSSGDAWMGLGTSAESIVTTAYHESPWRTKFAVTPPAGRYDFIAKLPKGARPQDVFAALQNEVKKTFGLVAHHEMREANVLILDVAHPHATKLKPSTGGNGSSIVYPRPGEFVIKNEPMRGLAECLEGYFRLPVIDRTGSTGNLDIDLKWPEANWRAHNPAGLEQALLDQLGLELVPTNMPIKMLVVERAK